MIISIVSTYFNEVIYNYYRKRAVLVNIVRLGEDPQQIVKGRKKLFTFQNFSILENRERKTSYYLTVILLYAGARFVEVENLII